MKRAKYCFLIFAILIFLFVILCLLPMTNKRFDFCKANGHSWYTSELDRVEPTCTQAGIQYYFCRYCDAEKQEILPAQHPPYDAANGDLHHALAAAGRNNSDYTLWPKAIQDAFWADVDLVVPDCMRKFIQNDVAQYAADESESLLGISAAEVTADDALQLKFSMYHRGFGRSWADGITERRYFEAMLAKYSGNLHEMTYTECAGIYTAIGVDKTEGIYAWPPDEQNGIVIKAPTCTAEGQRQYICPECGDALNAVIPKLEACPLAGYTDMTNINSWYHDAAGYVVTNQIMSSTSTAQLTFSPDCTTSRAMAVQALYNLERKPSINTASQFTDVQESDWYYTAVVWASENGIVCGKGDGIFDPQGAVTREQFVSFLYRYVVNYMGHPMEQTADLSSFPDGAKTSTWARDSIKWAIGCGMISGRNNGGTIQLAPQENLTRAELASVLMQLKLNPEVFCGTGKAAIIVRREDASLSS